MSRAGITLALLLAAPVAAGAQTAVETTVTLADPERAAVRTRIPSGSAFAGESGFHGLAGGPEQGWRRETMRFRGDPRNGLAFESLIEAGSDGWLRVAIPIPDDPPPAGADLSFQAEITPPPGHRIVDLFPAGAAPEGGGTVRLSLPAPPAMIRFRVVPAGAVDIGLALVVDGVVAVVLIGLAVVGTRRLRRAPAPHEGDAP